GFSFRAVRFPGLALTGSPRMRAGMLFAAVLGLSGCQGRLVGDDARDREPAGPGGSDPGGGKPGPGGGPSGPSGPSDPGHMLPGPGEQPGPGGPGAGKTCDGPP